MKKEVVGLPTVRGCDPEELDSGSLHGTGLVLQKRPDEFETLLLDVRTFQEFPTSSVCTEERCQHQTGCLEESERGFWGPKASLWLH